MRRILSLVALLAGLSVSCGPSGEQAAKPENAPPVVTAPGETEAPPQTAETEAFPDYASVEIGSVTLIADADSNGGRPVEVDLVLVYDPALITLLETMGAQQWFFERGMHEQEAAGGLLVSAFTVAPGQTIPETPIEASPGAVAAFVYAGYGGAGEHRERIEGSGTLQIVLGADGFTTELLQ